MVYLNNEGMKIGEYEGTWRDGHPDGRGMCEYQNPFAKYDGEFERSKRHGQGTYYCEQFKYEGSWKDGQMDGQGKLTYLDQNGNETSRFYEGSMRNNQMDGYGKYQYHENKYFEGEFRDGKKHGKGYLWDKKRDQKLEGYWQNGQTTGAGIMTSISTNQVAIGQFNHKSFIVSKSKINK